MKVSFAVGKSLKWNNQSAPVSPRAHNTSLGQRPTRGERKQRGQGGLTAGGKLPEWNQPQQSHTQPSGLVGLQGRGIHLCQQLRP